MVPVHTNFGGNGMLVSSVSLFGGLVLGLMAVSPLRATPLSPVTHTINFDTTAGLTPDSGDFTYNPGSSTFSNFVIHWDGAAFDFTSQANSGIGGNSCGDHERPGGEVRFVGADFELRVAHQRRLSFLYE
jgi:hypothetical protein